MTEINDATLIALGAESAERIRAGVEAYPCILRLPRVVYDQGGNNFARWRGVPVERAPDLPPLAVEVVEI